MNNRKPTLTIGIAAYNEEANIGQLLSELLLQKIDSADLQGILVVSDASTDNTDTLVKSFESGLIKLLRLEKRSGANGVQNVIKDQSTSDILILLNADILPENQNFIENLIRPIVKDPSVGLTSAVLLPAKPYTFFEKILAHNHQFKSKLFASIGNGNNIYTCYGPARAFARPLYKAFHYTDTIPCDAASYMFCMKEKMRFVSVSYPRAIFRCPSNFRDHIKQSSRFAAGKDSLIMLFGDSAKKAYSIPYMPLVIGILKECVLHPIFFISFFIVWCFTRTRKSEPFTSSWDMATSSKKI